MGAKAYNLIDELDFRPGDCVVEIGAERGEGSTDYLERFCKRKNIPFFSVDIEPNRIGTLRMSGEVFLQHFTGNIRFAYLDNYDYIFPEIEGESWVDDQRQQYKQLGYELTNDNSKQAHLDQALMVAEMSDAGSRILLDDTYFEHEITGKGGWAVPALLGLGYKILNDVSEEITGYIMVEKQ
jgi:hypothetical protein